VFSSRLRRTTRLIRLYTRSTNVAPCSLSAPYCAVSISTVSLTRVAVCARTVVAVLVEQRLAVAVGRTAAACSRAPPRRRSARRTATTPPPRFALSWRDVERDEKERVVALQRVPLGRPLGGQAGERDRQRADHASTACARRRAASRSCRSRSRRPAAPCARRRQTPCPCRCRPGAAPSSDNRLLEIEPHVVDRRIRR
jgi:hypothetical protein